MHRLIFANESLQVKVNELLLGGQPSPLIYHLEMIEHHPGARAETSWVSFETHAEPPLSHESHDVAVSFAARAGRPHGPWASPNFFCFRSTCVLRHSIPRCGRSGTILAGLPSRSAAPDGRHLEHRRPSAKAIMPDLGKQGIA